MTKQDAGKLKVFYSKRSSDKKKTDLINMIIK